MYCHECAAKGVDRPALGVCRYCFVGLCKEHIIGSYQGRIFPRFSCEHRPWDAFAVSVRALKPVREVPRAA